jgi:hypothetical protein
VYLLDVSESISLCEGAVARDGDGLKNCCNTFPVEAKGEEKEVEEEEDSEGSDGGREAQARTFRSQEFAFLPYLCRR